MKLTAGLFCFLADNSDNRYLAGFSRFNFYLHSGHLGKAVPGQAAPVGTDIIPLDGISADLLVVVFYGTLVRARKSPLAFLDIYMKGG